MRSPQLSRFARYFFAVAALTAGAISAVQLPGCSDDGGSCDPDCPTCVGEECNETCADGACTLGCEQGADCSLDCEGGESPRKDEAPALLAIRAVELLRASLLELASPAAPSKKDPDLPPEVKKLTEPAPPATNESRRTGFGIEAGMMGLLSVDGIHPALAPMFRASYGAAIGVGARITWAGPSFGPGLEGELGQAVITQYLGLAELVYSPPLGGPVALLFNGGLGAYHVSASGELLDPQRARSGGSTTFIATWGAGLDFRIHRRFGLALETMAGVSAPGVTIDMGSEQVGRFGRPILGASLGAVGLF